MQLHWFHSTVPLLICSKQPYSPASMLSDWYPQLPALTMYSSVSSQFDGCKELIEYGAQILCSVGCQRSKKFHRILCALLEYPRVVDKKGGCLLGPRPGRESSAQFASTSTM